jgi:capsular exopolysaccharide synthesis family protein
MDGNKKIAVDIPSLVLDILAGWKVILMLAATCAMVTFVLTAQLVKPAYRSSTTLIISSRSNSGNAYSNLTATLDMTTAFSLVLDSEALRTQVSDQLGEPVPAGTITAESIPETNLLVLSVTADKPDKAFRIMKTVQEVYPKYSGSIMGTVSIRVLEPARVPSAPMSASPARRYAGYALLLGLLAGMALFGVLSYLRDTVKNPLEASDKLDTRLLASVPYQSRRLRRRRVGKTRRKVSLLITNFNSNFWFVEAYKRLRMRVTMLMKDDQKTLMVTSTLENEGKSTVCANLALALAQAGKKVLLIDGDLRKPAIHKVLEKPTKSSLSYARYLTGQVSDWHGLVQEKSGLSLLLCPKPMGDNADELLTSARMQALLAQTRQEYDFVLLDTPPLAVALDSQELASLVDTALLVVRCNAALAMDVNDSISLLKEQGNGVLGCVFNGASGVTFGSGGYGYGQKNYASSSRDTRRGTAQ